MSVVRLIFLFLLGSTLAFVITRPAHNWTLNTNTNTNKTIKSLGPKPNAYQLLIDFNDNKYNLTETVNQGSTKIFIDVTANEQIFRGGITQIVGEYNCKLSTEPHFLTGSFNVSKTMTINTNVSDEYLIEKSRNQLKEYLQKQIQKQ